MVLVGALVGLGVRHETLCRVGEPGGTALQVLGVRADELRQRVRELRGGVDLAERARVELEHRDHLRRLAHRVGAVAELLGRVAQQFGLNAEHRHPLLVLDHCDADT